MPHNPTEWPSDEAARQLLADLVAGGAGAPHAFARAFLDPLTAYLERAVRWATPDQAATAAEDAILETCRYPARIDPAKLGPIPYLKMAARRDLLNESRRERRHRRPIPLSAVELEPRAGNCSREADGPSWDDPRLVAVAAGLDGPDRVVWELMRGGERRVSVYAERLGLTHLPRAECAREVKRVKERIFKRFQRAVGGGR